MSEDTQENKDAKAGESDSVSLDMSQAKVKKLLAKAKERGYVTYDEINGSCLLMRYPQNKSKT